MDVKTATSTNGSRSPITIRARSSEVFRTADPHAAGIPFPPDRTPEKREEVRSIVAAVDQAVQTADISQSVERSRDREREAAKNPDRDLGMGM